MTTVCKVTLDEVKENNQKIGHHWFDKATLRFFHSRIARRGYKSVLGNVYFWTSEAFELTGPRKFTVRMAYPDGKVTTIGEFQAYRTREDADSVALSLALKGC